MYRWPVGQEIEEEIMAFNKETDWVGFDLDGTLAHYELGDYLRRGAFSFGPPIVPMVERVKQLIERGITCKVVTARYQTYPLDQGFAWDEVRAHNMALEEAVGYWTLEYCGEALEVTNAKDGYMYLMVDDRGVTAQTNTGYILGSCARWKELFPIRGNVHSGDKIIAWSDAPTVYPNYWKPADEP